VVLSQKQFDTIVIVEERELVALTVLKSENTVGNAVQNDDCHRTIKGWWGTNEACEAVDTSLVTTEIKLANNFARCR